MFGHLNQNGNFIPYGVNNRVEFSQISYGVNSKPAGGKRFCFDLNPLVEGIHKGMLQPFFGQMWCCAGVALLVFVIAAPYESAVGIRGMPNLPAIEPTAIPTNDSG